MRTTAPGTAKAPLKNDRPATAPTRAGDGLRLWQLNLMRVGYFVMGVLLAVVKWPLLFEGKTWGLAEGTVLCMLVAMSVLALLGLRYPQRMLPILIFEVAWKLTWLGLVALPAWLNDTMDQPLRTQAAKVLWVVIVIAVIPWRPVIRQYLLAPGDPWLRRR
ncbi:MAG: hypothetical protein ABI692_11585 [Terracoccus sp.]